MRGARAVQQAIIQGFPLADISISIVWINMLAPDSNDAARKSATIIEDPRACHFYDPQKLVGKAIARSLGGLGKVAWDVYLFYPAGSEWNGGPPAPAEWAHQLSDRWADPAHHRWGDDLVKALDAMMRKLIAA